MTDAVQPAGARERNILALHLGDGSRAGRIDSTMGRSGSLMSTACRRWSSTCGSILTSTAESIFDNL